MSGFEVVTGGEVMGLVLASGGPLALAQHADLSCAGSEGTVAVGLARLGHRVQFFGRVGADAFGSRVRRALAGDGVDVSALRDDHRPTGLLLRDRVTDRAIEVAYARVGSAGSALAPDDVPIESVRSARVLHVTALTAALSGTAHDAVMAAVVAARDAGTTVVLDPNTRLRVAQASVWRELTSELAPLADVVLVGGDDARVICGDQDPTRWFHDAGTGTVVVKTGYGATESTADGFWSVSGRRVPVVDPVGAGDAFAAGWISAYLRGVTGADRLREAHAVASCSVGHPGDLDGLPTAAVRQQMVAREFGVPGEDVLR
ncbi:MAG: sugar kinase [Cellulomonas sp.]